MASTAESISLDIVGSNSRDPADQLGNTSLRRAADDKYAEAFTDLRFAADFEDARGFTSILKQFPEAPNIHGETPIFLAVLSGSKKFFSAVTSELTADTIDITMLRRNDGETILHYAITAEYFDLATDILERFSQLVYCRNSRGLTPLHILASNPSAFESGCEFGSLISSFLYHYLTVSAESPLDELGDAAEHYPSLSECLSLWLEVFKGWIRYFADAGREIRSIDTRTSVQCVRDLFYRFLQWAFVCTLIVPILASPVVLILAWPVFVAIFGFLNCRATMKYLKHKHMWANEVMEKLLRKINKWQEFSEINSGMNPYKYQVEWTSGTKPGIKLLQRQGDETPTTLLQEKEIPTAFETNFIQKSQQIPSTVSTKGMSLDPLKEESERGVIESPIMIAVKKGIKEMVKRILERFPEAVGDKDSQRKNIMFLAVERRQFIAYLFERLTRSPMDVEVDAEGNSILHLAAKYPHNQGLVMTDAAPALQMLREITWFNYFKKVLPPYFSNLLNHKGQTASEVFIETHQQLAIQRAKWLGNASQSCSVVATLIISVVFATISTVPGGLMQDKGHPVYRGKLAFNVFSVASLFAMCFSAISLIMFLGILTAPYQEFGVGNNLPKKLIYGLASLFISITALFLSFFCGVLFVLDSKMQYIAYPIFILTSCVALASFPLYSENVKPMITDILTGPHSEKLAKLEKGWHKLLHQES